MTDKMAGKKSQDTADDKSTITKVGESIKRGGEAVADVARDALDGAADLHTDADYKAPKDQTWAKEVEGEKVERKK